MTSPMPPRPHIFTPAPNAVVTGPASPAADLILTPEALLFLGELALRFDSRRLQLLAKRKARDAAFDGGALPDFLAATASIRDGDWRVADIPADLLDRRVEITGPPTRKMTVNALNSGAKVFMADFEDALSPSFANVLDGQVTMRSYWAGTLDFTDGETGKGYTLRHPHAVLIVRPRGWHLPEAHIRYHGAPMSAALVDFGLYLFHNAAAMMAQGRAPYLYLPKLESHEEARLWAEVIRFAETRLGLPRGSTKVTVLIETLPAAFEMDEILWELREHIVALNCGRWDYMFSYIKTLREKPDYILPDRKQVVMGSGFLKAYSELLIKTCHRRGALAMGGMAAAIPNRRDAAANEAGLAAVRADKEREAGWGHDGTWVAHPDLVPVALEVFDRVLGARPNQLDIARDDVAVAQADMLGPPPGTRTPAGLRENVSAGMQYIAAWIGGAGAVPINNLMEDAATAELCRTQLWQWRHHGATLEDGRVVTAALIEETVAAELAALKALPGASPELDEAALIVRRLATFDALEPFFTLPVYRLLQSE